MIIPSPSIKPQPEVQAGCWSGFKQSLRKNKSTPRSKLPQGGLTAGRSSAQPQLVCTRPRYAERDLIRWIRSPSTPSLPHVTFVDTEIKVAPQTGGRRTNLPRTPQRA